MPTPPPVALSIAGSDCSAGAGIQADLKTFSAHRVFGLTAVTCVVAEVPGQVGTIAAIAPETLTEQLDLLRHAFPISAIKTGMLYSREHVSASVGWLQSFDHPALVIDPVMVATSGDSLVKDGALDHYTRELLPMATVITPNIDEACALSDMPIGCLRDLEHCATLLAKKFGTHVLAKGGHLQDDSGLATDILASNPSGNTQAFSAPFVQGVSTHGTGCTYSAAIAAGLAKGHDLPIAIASAKRFVTSAIRGYFRWQHTDTRQHTDALNHFQQD